MISYQKYFTDMVEEKAESKGWLMIEQRDFTNCGLWIFKKKGVTVKQVYFDFQSGYGWIRLGKGNVYSGVRFDYGDDANEMKAINFIFN